MQTPRTGAGLSRQTLLTIVLFAVLLMSTAGAWLLARGRTSLARTAAEIVEQIRSDGLAAHWGPQTVRWHLRRKDAGPVGWRLLLRARRDGGAFEGLEFIVIGLGPQQHVLWSYWTLNANATRGTYFSQVLSSRRFGPAWALMADSKTAVTLADRRITIQQDIDGGSFVSGAAAPPTYLPEGTMTLARSLVARRKTGAVFKITLDALPPAGQRPRFVPVKMRYQPADGVPGASSAVAVQARGGGRDTFYLDDKGLAIRTVSAETVEQAAELEQVQASFADTADPGFVLRVVRGHAAAVGLVRRLLLGREQT